jgi:PEP-CTERM putative exosortase interaction domain
MNNLYQKVAVAYVGIALGFTLGVTKEVKAATFTLPFTTLAQGADIDISEPFTYDGLGDYITPLLGSNSNELIYIFKGLYGEVVHLSEFNIGSFSFAPNTVITKAVLQVKIFGLTTGYGIVIPTNPGSLGIFGYVGNGTPEVSDFEAGVFLSSVDVSSSSADDILNFDVTPFVNQRVKNQDAFAGFGIRALNLGGLSLNNNEIPNDFLPLGLKPRLILETADVAEPVPEPTTIFGSALALTLGGWLKRKKSNPQNKATSQH